jgi:hypothetical protein
MSISVLALHSQPQLSGAWHTHVSVTPGSSTQYSKAVHGDSAVYGQHRSVKLQKALAYYCRSRTYTGKCRLCKKCRYIRTDTGCRYQSSSKYYRSSRCRRADSRRIVLCSCKAPVLLALCCLRQGRSSIVVGWRRGVPEPTPKSDKYVSIEPSCQCGQ